MTLPGLLLVPLVLQQGGPPHFKSVHLAFAEEHSASFVSGFGHVFVCLPESEVETTADLMRTTVVNFGADTSPLGKGMWVGEYKLQACHELVRRNAFFDQRKVTFFELTIDPDDLESLRADLIQRLSRSYPYDFFRHNCGQYLWDWLDGPEPSPTAHLYLTPREAVDKILQRFPPRRVRVVRSDADLLQAYLSQSDPSLRGSVIAAIEEPELFLDIQDLTLRLLALKVAESRSNRESHVQLQGIRDATLDQPGGPDAARRLLRFQEELEGRGEQDAWPGEAEGPAVSLGVASSSDSGRLSPRVHLEAGLRDSHTLPQPQGLLREVKFLSATVEGRPDGPAGDLLLASLSSLRDMSRIVQAASNGASAGYLGLPNSTGTSGLFASTWTGWSVRTQSGWFSGRLSLTGDELQDHARVALAPGLTWDILRDSWTFHLEAHYSLRDGLGWEWRQDWLLDRNSTLRIRWVNSPLGEEGLSVDFQYRF